MPRPKEPEPLVKVKLNLFERDYSRLKDLYPSLGPARVIRALVHAHVGKIERAAGSVQINLLEDIEIDEEDISLD